MTIVVDFLDQSSEDEKITTIVSEQSICCMLTVSY